jgi:hypothetical protein
VSVVPSQLHEALLLLFRNRPELAPELLRDALHIELPSYTEVRIESADLTEVVPSEYRADLIVLLVDGRPVLAIVVEVQLARDERKRFTWPVYVVGCRARFECPAVVLVVTPTESVARWAATPIALGPGSTLQPLVVGPGAVPVVTDHAAAAREPELAVLSALAHDADPPEQAAPVALAALAACLGLEDERALLYSDLLRALLGAATRSALETLMQSQGYEFQSEFARRHTAHGKAEAVLAVLDARGLAVSAPERERILACTDLATLEQWVRRAVTAGSASELLG